MSVKWGVREIGPQMWWAVDQGSGAALKLREDEALPLWQAPNEARLRELAAVRRQATPNDALFVDLEFMGLRMRYWCRRAELAQEIVSQYASLVPRWRRSPDIEAELADNIDFDRLHRSSPGPRQGVRVRNLGETAWQEGSAELPVLPLLQARSFAGRYCGLHGALLATAEGGVIVCGSKKAGKTSTALIAKRLGLGVILADETTLIDRDGTAHGIPLPIRERSLEGRIVRALAPTDLRQRSIGMNVSHIVILQHAEEAAQWQRVDDDAEALRLLVPHLRVLNTSLGEATDRLLGLVECGRLWRWRVSAWPLLEDDLAYGLQEILGENQGRQDVASIRA